MSGEIKADHWRHFCSIRNYHSHSVKYHPAPVHALSSITLWMLSELFLQNNYRVQGKDNVSLTHCSVWLNPVCMFCECFSSWLLPYCKTCWCISFIYLLQSCALAGHSNQNISSAQNISVITDMPFFYISRLIKTLPIKCILCWKEFKFKKAQFRLCNALNQIITLCYGYEI